MKKKFFATMCTAGLLGAGLALVSPGTAAAIPTNCSTSKSGYAITGTCTGGTGQFRLKADCQWQPDRNSPWHNVGETASVKCTVGGAPRGATFEMRN